MKWFSSLILLLVFNIAHAESWHIMLKPQRGIAGTSNLNFNQDGSVSLLVYQSATKLEEARVELSSEQVVIFRRQAELVMAQYQQPGQLQMSPLQPLATTIIFSGDGVSRQVSAKRYTAELKALITGLIEQVPTLSEKISVDF